MAETPNVTPTVEELNLNSNVVRLNDYHVTGTGDAFEVLRLTLPPRYIKQTGADGHVQYVGTGELGGEAIITLKFGAPSLLTMRDWLLKFVAGNHPTYNGTVARSDGSQLLLHNGMLTGEPGGWSRVGYQSFRFVFEVIG